MKELIYIAVDANATHMYLPGVRQHITAALAADATGAEIMEELAVRDGQQHTARQLT